MARIRTIKPEYFTDEEVAWLSVWARLIFPGIWCHADREGRLEDRPKRLKALILPYDDAVDFEAALDELVAAGFLIRYEAEGKRLLQVRTFGRHQHPHVKESASTLPGPPQEESSTMQAPGLPSADTVQAPDQHRASTLDIGREGNGETPLTPLPREGGNRERSPSRPSYRSPRVRAMSDDQIHAVLAECRRILQRDPGNEAQQRLADQCRAELTIREGLKKASPQKPHSPPIASDGSG